MTELTWDGKYTNGRRNAPVRIALPFQTIETVNESAKDREKTLSLFASDKPAEWRNRLIWGDKKYVLPSLLPEFAGKVNLIYIDPPFDTGADFSFTAKIPVAPDSDGDEETQFVKEPSIIEQKAYRDTWGKGLDSYLQWFYETAVLLRELLSDNGSIYVHLDWHVGHYAKVVLDEVFGYDNFQREIIWRMGWVSGYKTMANNWIRNHDTILYYTKDYKAFTFNKEWIPYPPDYERWGGRKKGQGLAIEDIWGIHVGEQMNSLSVISFANENLGYPTQKSESLLNRILKASSNEGDLVLDCFCGSGTTAAVAEKLNRRWITCDLGRFAIHTARKRLLGIDGVKPFVVQNLGKYERQAWQQAEFESAEESAYKTKELRYRNFILNLFKAEPVSGYLWLHGVRSGRMIHVGAVDSPVAYGDVQSVVKEFWQSVGKTKTPSVNGIDILGWDFAFDLNETARHYAAENNIDLKFRKIPREVLEKKAVEQGDIYFFELASLSVDVKVQKRNLFLELENFIVPPDDVPEDIRNSITHWSQWIDYWAVDWDYKNDTFHNQWQAYRTKKDKSVTLKTGNIYDESGEYTVVIKVIDILGNDTTKAINIKIK